MVDTPKTRQADSMQGQTLGPYQLRGRLAAGGMGTVYEAFDPRLHRLVAVKVLSRHLLNEQEARARFRREALSAARLNHPNVVTVYEADEDDGLFYIAMELVTGGSVQDHVAANGPRPWPEATRLLADACRGLASAHEAGLVHRDIKPGNLLLTGEGAVKVADFGLARLAGAGSALTGDGAIMGTPEYMSPEQCRGEKACPRSDLYALGAVYYFLLTGTPPFRGEGPLAVMFAHCASPPPDLPGLSPGCSAIISRALAKDRDSRYPDARAMLADLQMLLGVASAPAATAVRPPAPDDAFTRRGWLWAAAGAVVGAAAMWGLNALPHWTWPRATPDGETGPGPVPGPGDRSPPPGGPLSLKFRAELPGHKGEVREVAFSRDGKLLVTAGDGTAAHVWQMPAGRPLWELGPTVGKRIQCAAFAPDGKTLATGGDNVPICFWCLQRGERLPAGNNERTVYGLAYTPDGSRLVLATDEYGVQVWQIRGRSEMRAIVSDMLERKMASAAATSPDGSQFAAVIRDDAAYLWKVPDKVPAENLALVAKWKGPVRALAFAPRGGLIALGALDGALLWAPGKEPVKLAPGAGGPVVALAWAPDGRTLAHSSGGDGPVMLRHLPTGRVWAAPQDTARVRSMAFSPDGKTLVTGGLAGRVVLWDVLPDPGPG